MAKQKGNLKLVGTIGDLTFYQDENGEFIVKKKRKKTGKRNKSKSGVKAQRTQFGTAAQYSSLLYQSIARFRRNSCDRNMISRINLLFFQLLNLDEDHQKGKRRIASALKHPESVELIRRFKFRKNYSFNSILQTNYELNESSEQILLTNVVPNIHFKSPKYATHVGLKCATLWIDFEKPNFEIKESDEVNLLLDETVQDITFPINSTEKKTGHVFHLLKVNYFKEINGVQETLLNESFNCMGFVV